MSEFYPTAQAAQDLARKDVDQSKDLLACASQRGEGVHELDAAVSKVCGVSCSHGETVDPGDRRDLSVD